MLTAKQLKRALSPSEGRVSPALIILWVIVTTASIMCGYGVGLHHGIHYGSRIPTTTSVVGAKQVCTCSCREAQR